MKLTPTLYIPLSKMMGASSLARCPHPYGAHNITFWFKWSSCCAISSFLCIALHSFRYDPGKLIDPFNEL